MNAPDFHPTPPAVGQPVCLDLARARSMLGNADSLQRIMRMAAQRLDVEIDAIAANLAAGDVAGAHHMLHGLKGFAPIFCNDQLSEQISHVEQLSKTETAQHVATVYHELAPRLAGLRDEMKLFLQA
jgi:HPt (histidine-containing phosphotransfer) domain-containing protein